MHHRPLPRHRVARLWAAAAVGALTLVAATTPAGAHSDEGVLEVVERSTSELGDEVTYLVALTYANDGHEADDATVTATPLLQNVGPQPAVTLTSTGAGGGYEGSLRLPAPGTWTITFESTDPAATVTDTVTVRSAPNPTAAPVTTPDATDDDAPPTTPPPEVAQLAEDDDAGGDDGPPVALFVGVAVAALALTAGGALALRRRATATDAD